MKLFLMISLVIILLFSTISCFMSSSSSCQQWSDTCRSGEDCCPGKGRRIVCAPHLEICGKKKTCCITEVEEQQERQAALIRDRNPKLIVPVDPLPNKEKSKFYV